MRKNILLIAVALFFVNQLSSQYNQNSRVPLIGEGAPSFTANSTNGKINFPDDFGKKWKILFAHPKDFTPVCSSEILELAQQQKDYEDLDAQLLILSADLLSQHESWKSALEELNYKDRPPVKIKFPIIEDNDLSISHKYGMIHPLVSSSENIRAIFIIDPKNKIRFINFYPNEVGRNICEIKRTLMALQTADAGKNIATPANWSKGDDVIVKYMTEGEKNTLNAPNSDLYQVSWFMTFRKIRTSPANESSQ